MNRTNQTAAFLALITIAACGSQETSKPAEEPAPASDMSFPVSPTRDISTHSTAIPLPGTIKEPLKTMPSFAEPLEIEPTSFSDFMQRGTTRFTNGYYAGAKVDYEQAALMRPASFRSHVQFSRVSLELGDLGAAREQVEYAIEIDGGSSLAWNTLGRIELAEKEYDAAIVSFERAVDENKDNSYAWNNLGLAYITLERFDEAAIALEQATSGLYPKSYMWNNLGMSYEHLNELDLARASYRQAADSGSNKAQGHLNRLKGVVSVAAELTAIDVEDSMDAGTQDEAQ